ncbi:MAG: hypothetical protein NXH75_08750, partial [Halobacteriovoraceae bacterium]|nr:hypothetical protein [Halobacteriovoraceae bacterium]
MKIALLTCPEIPLGTSDDQRLFPTLKERGFEPSFINWKDLNNSFDVALIRSPWNYTQFYEQFL